MSLRRVDITYALLLLKNMVISLFRFEEGKAIVIAWYLIPADPEKLLLFEMFSFKEVLLLKFEPNPCDKRYGRKFRQNKYRGVIGCIWRSDMGGV